MQPYQKGANPAFNWSGLQFEIPPLDGNGTLVFTAFRDDRLFLSQSSSTTSVVTQIIDVAILGVNTSVLSVPARLIFSVPRSSSTSLLTCVYFEESTGIWSRKGVSIVSRNATSIICAATHFTNFAAIVVSYQSISISISLSHLRSIELCLAIETQVIIRTHRVPHQHLLTQTRWRFPPLRSSAASSP